MAKSDAEEVKALKMDSTCESLYEDNSNNNGIIGNSSTSSSTGSCSDTDQRGHTGDDQEMEEEDEEEEEEEDKEIIKRIENEEMKVVGRKEGEDDEEMTLADDGNDNDGNLRQEADRAGKNVTNTKAVTSIIVMPPPTNRIDILDEDEEEDDDEDDDDDDNNDDIYKSNFVVIKSPDPPTPTRTWSVEGPKLHIPQPPQRHLHLSKPQVQQAPKPYLHPQHQKQRQLSGQQLKVKEKQIHDQPIKNYAINPVNTGKARGVAGATHVTGPNEVPIKSGRGRGITLNMLMKDGVIEPGGGCLSIEYLGKKFSADLLPNGKIRWQENNEIFNSPSAWASHCKKLVNPSKKSGCGWASIKYKGRKLVSWKSMWCRKQRQNGNPSSKLVSSPLDDCPAEIMKSNLKLKDMFPKVPDYELGHCPSLKPPLPAHINQCHKSVNNGKNKKRQHVDWSPNEFQEEALNLSLKGGPENIQKTRQSQQQQQQQSPQQQQQRNHHQQQQSPQQRNHHQQQSPQQRNHHQQQQSQQRNHHQQQQSPQQRNHHQQQQSPQQQRNHHQQHHQSPTSPLSIPPPLPPPPVPTPPQQHQKLKQKQQHHHHQQSQPKQPLPPPPQQQQQQPKQQPQPKHSDPHSEILDPTHPRFPLVKHSNLLNRNADQDPNTLVQCETFESYGKFQPFSVSVTTNSMFLIDFHCHLTNSEVLGYLAGRWDQNTQHLNILQAFPCLSRLGDKENAPLIEAEIRHRMNKSGLSLVGWYHSHPHRSASPTIRDIDCQMTYQLKMKGIGSTYHPCLGFIIAPYDKTSKKKESTFQAFWVMPPPMDQPSDYGIPMKVQFSIYQNPSLTEELLTEMKNLVDFYKGSPDVVRFANIWQQTVTYLDKVKWSLLTKLPQDQDENSSTLEFVRTLLLSMRV